MDIDDPIVTATALLSHTLQPHISYDYFNIIPTPDGKLKVYVVKSMYNEMCLYAPPVYYGYTVTVFAVG